MKKNIIFIGILLFTFALSKLLTFQQPAEDKIELTFINLIQQYIATVKLIYFEYPITITILFSTSFFLLTIMYVPFTGPLYVLFAGALYGFIKGTVLFSFLVSMSYTVSFVISRYIFIRYFKKKEINKKINHVIKGFEKDGWVYLLSLRFAGVVPSFILNLALGFTKIPVWQFYIITQIGTFPHILVYAFAGSKVKNLKSIDDLISPYFFLLLIFLSITPIILKIISDFILRPVPP